MERWGGVENVELDHAYRILQDYIVYSRLHISREQSLAHHFPYYLAAVNSVQLYIVCFM